MADNCKIVNRKMRFTTFLLEKCSNVKKLLTLHLTFNVARNLRCIYSFECFHKTNFLNKKYARSLNVTFLTFLTIERLGSNPFMSTGFLNEFGYRETANV